MNKQTENVLQIVENIFSWVDRTKVFAEINHRSGSISIEIQTEAKPYAFRIVGITDGIYSQIDGKFPFWIHIPEEELTIAQKVVDLANRYINNK